MSSVRMCDNCGSIFSELTENWTTMAGSRSYTNPNTGKRETQHVEKDVCGPCNGFQVPKLVPQIPAGNLPPVNQT